MQYLHGNICLQKGSVQISSISFWFEVSYPSQRTVLIGKMFKIPHHQGPGLGFPLIIFSSTSHACSSELTCSKLSIAFDGISKKKNPESLTSGGGKGGCICCDNETSKYVTIQHMETMYFDTSTMIVAYSCIELYDGLRQHPQYLRPQSIRDRGALSRLDLGSKLQSSKANVLEKQKT